MVGRSTVRHIVPSEYHAPIGDLEAYIEALRAWDAGAIELAPDEDPGMVLLMARRASTLLGLRVLTCWGSREPATLYWLVLDRPEAPAPPVRS